EYLLVEHHGGFWCDAEKAPGSDGAGNPAPDNPGDKDDLLCWAATACNMLEWTGWGFAGTMVHGNTDDFFEYFYEHITDYGGYVYDGIDWWFDGTLPAYTDGNPSEYVDHVGFWTTYSAPTYNSMDWSNPNTLPNIRGELMAGHAVGIHIYPIVGDGGHVITVWGFNYDSTLDPVADKEDYYLGIWVTDSDNSKNSNNPDDILRYYAVEWNATANYWYMPNYGAGWCIGGVGSLAPFPGELRPTANVANIVGTEGVAITFDASASTDPDGDALEYRWDFDGDGTWDTAWSASPTATHTWNDDYTGTVYLEVFDGRLRDIDTATITVNNAAPILTLSDDSIDENGIATISGTISDLGSEDTFVLTINWGEGLTENHNFGPGTTTFSLSHQYLDDNPTGTTHDTYIVSVSVSDDDGGSDSDTASVIVYNVNPVANIEIVSQVNAFELDENIVVMLDPTSFTATATDIGTDDLTFSWNWGDGTSDTTITYLFGGSPVMITDVQEHIFAEPGIYTITLTVFDDDLGITVESLNVTVLGPRDLKVMAIEELESLKTGCFCSDVKLEHIILQIEHSLCDRLWEDEIRLNPMFGTCVFSHERAAVNRLELMIFHNNVEICKLEKKIAWLEAKGRDITDLEAKIATLEAEILVHESIILKLIKADELLSRIALEDAQNTPVENGKFQNIVDHKLSKANDYILLAQDHLDSGNYSEAISCYKLSWIYSQCAIKFAKK
ncbi:MAG: PKD domain-containing protein, partial [Candidatus Lokiarchaeota archaeon]|nr:PKD domain-containing protein [Candidatus Lokiarchaeota archaeon]